MTNDPQQLVTKGPAGGPGMEEPVLQIAPDMLAGEPSIDNFDHIGGFAGGMVIVLLMKPRAGLAQSIGFDVIGVNPPSR
ncbi:MAG: hypothetical protein ABSH20_15355 [Tepidisphaeraceae bacterium]|jgi:membrane associated rhomboid family serine protease